MIDNFVMMILNFKVIKSVKNLIYQYPLTVLKIINLIHLKISILRFCYFILSFIPIILFVFDKKNNEYYLIKLRINEDVKFSFRFFSVFNYQNSV